MGFSVRGPCAFVGFGDQRRPRAVCRPCGPAPASANSGPQTFAAASFGGLAPAVIAAAVTTIVTIAVLSKEITEVGGSVTKLDVKFDALATKLDAKFGQLEAKLDAKFDKLESKLDAKFDKFETRMDANFDKLTTRLDTLVAQGVLPRRK